MVRTFFLGLREEKGSWKIICISRRADFSSGLLSSKISRPLYSTLPSLLSLSLSMVLARVDLPQPDSPTMPRISPRYTEKDTSSTAFSMAPLSFPRCEVMLK
jgi:hypothetical protein